MTVTGSGVAPTTALITAAARPGSRIRAAPAPFLTTFLTGQPILISMPSMGDSLKIAAAAPITSGSAPKSCMITGRSAATVRISSKVLA